MKYLVWIAMLAAAVSCTRSDPPAPASAPPATPEPLAARVNGRPITEAEVTAKRRMGGRSRWSRQRALDKLIELELQAQAAEDRGLHQTEAFRSEMALARAALANARRRTLAKSYRMDAVNDLPEIPREAIDGYIDGHLQRIRSVVRLERITTRSRRDADRVAAGLGEGRAFEELMAMFPRESGPVGPLGFDTVPEPWWPAIDGLDPGGTSDVIPMRDGRFTILRLVERQTVSLPDQDSLIRRVEALLQARSLEDKREQEDAALRAKAIIERYGPSSP